MDGHEIVKNVWISYYREAVADKEQKTEDFSVDDVTKLIWNKVKCKICGLKKKLDNGA